MKTSYLDKLSKQLEQAKTISERKFILALAMSVASTSTEVCEEACEYIATHSDH